MITILQTPNHKSKAISNKAGPTNALVRIVDGKVSTSSLLVAQKFGKRHTNVLQAIARLECSAEFSRLNFKPRDYIDERGKTQPSFEMTKNGFAFLVMGFTGRAASEWKEAFIAAFDWQADEISRLRSMHGSPEWQSARLEGKSVRRLETDTIRVFVRYAESQGSKSANRYYLAITKATNKALFFIESATGQNLRDNLTTSQLASVAMAERIVERAIQEGMAAGLYYKEIYREAAERVRQLAAFIGPSIPGKEPLLLKAA